MTGRIARVSKDNADTTAQAPQNPDTPVGPYVSEQMQVRRDKRERLLDAGKQA